MKQVSFCLLLPWLFWCSLSWQWPSCHLESAAERSSERPSDPTHRCRKLMRWTGNPGMVGWSLWERSLLFHHRVSIFNMACAASAKGCKLFKSLAILWRINDFNVAIASHLHAPGAGPQEWRAQLWSKCWSCHSATGWQQFMKRVGPRKWHIMMIQSNCNPWWKSVLFKLSHEERGSHEFLFPLMTSPLCPVRTQTLGGRDLWSLELSRPKWLKQQGPLWFHK